jgi:precorrin-6B methylase 1
MLDPEPMVGMPQREVEDDHDLLTYGEAAVRLHEEIRSHRAIVAELERHGAADDIAKVRRRLEALEEAAERNRRQPINDANFERFFGFTGTAQRNT